MASSAGTLTSSTGLSSSLRVTTLLFITIGIIKYRDDLNTLIEEIGNEMYSKNFEDLFDMNDGKQVLAESYYNLAVILILLDNLIPGGVGE